jgi:D-arginine dehydrogenase
MGDRAQSHEVIVIGAGIAGASVASELATRFKTVLVERESQPGYHTTGRSAALFSTTYGPPAIRALSRASESFLSARPAGFSDNPLVSPRGALMLARADQRDAFAAMLEEFGSSGAIRRLDAAEARDMLPILRQGYAEAAILEPAARDIDVHALHQGYLRHFKAEGGHIVTDAEVRALDRQGGEWRVETNRGVFAGGIVVNAAGAWADELGAIAGCAPIGLVPKRRTALVVPAPAGLATSHWPMGVDIEEEFYMKPDAGRLLVSPADETPSPPCDAQPDEFDVAVCIDRIQRAFELEIPRIENRWAGLRSFVADKVPVVGFDTDVAGFFWLAGQGGYGIQTAPAMARLAAALVAGDGVPADIADQGLNESQLAPRRLDRAA